MNGVPLHPMIVHFPMVLVLLLPMFALGALWAIRRGVRPRPAWALPLLLSGALAVSAFVALRTGEAEEDRVERVVPESAIHEHEEAAERFLVLSGVLLLVVAAGMIGGTLGRAARLAGTAGAFALVIAGVQVGKAGGELVYVHGAGQAYAAGGTTEQDAGDREHGDDD
ncbi:MAG TPA: DUF2231 domain-containing protein [Longimicrobiales bacterium]|nr:DUF2231 domain-containing protein [Longimicrobiales bacterium]